VSLKDIPDIVRRLIGESIGSVPALEAILLLRADRDREWTAEDVAARLYISRTMAAHVLATLAASGFLAVTGQRYRYAPATAELEEAVTSLASAYASNLIGVTHLIHARPAASVLQFAEAFRLRREEP
jgi:DNA-binding IclR family transcriptional regulator